MFEYFRTAFKVIVGVITNERLAIAGLICLGILAIWIILSLVFSFQNKFSLKSREINEYISRNGLTDEAKEGLLKLSDKMPSEFQRGLNSYLDGQTDKPSKFIKRFESLDVELSGGVFNQNKSFLKTYINFVFVTLMLFSLAFLGNELTLTGYLIAEAAIVPLGFLLLAKVLYYVYTAIRQYQYRTAVDDFNDMLDNLDGAHKAIQKTESQNAKPESVNINADEIVEKIKAYLETMKPTIKEHEEKVENEYDNVIVAPGYEEETTQISEPESAESVETALIANETTTIEEAEETAENKAEEETQVAASEGNEQSKEPQDEEQIAAAKQKPAKKQTEIVDNFKVNFDAFLSNGEEETETAEPEPVKRGRGRPKKEVNQSGEFVIKNDKDFEEALERAEKLMRKNEQPLSASQTKRIEKQIKELVDAMTKYKENK